MLKVVFISNYFNHHQKLLSDSLHKNLNGNYAFIETEKIDEERLKMGWGMDVYPDYVFNYLKEAEKCKRIIDEADIIIYGSAPEFLIYEQLNKGKLAFKYTERIYKNGYNPLKLPVRLIRNYQRFGKYKNLYLLCASAYTYGDYAKTFNFKNKAFRWGYFPEFIKYESISEIIKQKNKNQILWCGRLIDLKHPEAAINAAEMLKNAGYDFNLKIIGTGVLESEIKSAIKQKHLDDSVSVLGAMSPEEVRKHMEQSQIFLFNSDKREGWGAVVNEAMNSACVVVSNNSPGSVPFLIDDGDNGIIYNLSDSKSLFEKVAYLLDNHSKLTEIAEAAYYTVADLWNCNVAAERFVELSKSILNGNLYPDLYNDGPCSKAEIVKELY